MSIVSALIGSAGILLSGLGAVISAVRADLQVREPARQQAAGAAAVAGQLPEAGPQRQRLERSAWVSVDFGLGAWSVALLLIVLVAATPLGVSRMLLLGVIACVGALSFAAVFFGVRTMWEAVSGRHQDLALRAGSGVLAAVGALAVMLVVGGTGPLLG
jgi:hypothetical protein